MSVKLGDWVRAFPVIIGLNLECALEVDPVEGVFVKDNGNGTILVQSWGGGDESTHTCFGPKTVVKFNEETIHPDARHWSEKVKKDWNIPPR